MTTIVTRAGKGSALTHTELDTNFTNLNTDKVEASGDSMTGNLSFGDNNKAVFGAGSDLQIYHSGSHSFITDSGTGSLFIGGDTETAITNAAGTEYKLRTFTNGSVSLYYDNASKLSTTSTGIDVTGTVTADGLGINTTSTAHALTSSTTNSYSQLRLQTNDTDNTVQYMGLTFRQYDKDEEGYAGILGYTDSSENRISIGGATGLYNAATTLQFFTASNNTTTVGSERMRITSAGLVGIATSNPTVELDVDGGFKSDYRKLNNNSANTSSSSSGYYKIGSITIANSQGAEIKVLGTAGYGSGSDVSGLTVIRLRGDNSGTTLNGYFYGNTRGEETLTHVGYVNTGTNQFDIYVQYDLGGSAVYGALESIVDTGGSWTPVSSMVNIGSAPTGYVALPSKSTITTSGLKRLTAESNGDISFYEDTGTTAKFFWDASAEYLGIGTTSPATRIHGAGNLTNEYVAVQNTNATGGTSRLKLYNTSDTNQNGFQIINNGDDGNVNILNYKNSALAFWTNTTERMRIDSSGNLLVGKTSADTLNTAGAEIQSDGQVKLASDGKYPLQLNRLASDGVIVDFRKDGTTVGSIGGTGSTLDIGSGDTNLRFNPSLDNIYPVTAVGGGARDAAVDLGVGVSRFKDLYLSGGVYLGGTGAANLLDDYEIGTWTPIYVPTSGAFGTITYDVSNNVYVKIGEIVHCQCILRTDSLDIGTASGVLKVGGLPFNVQNFGSGGIGYTGGFSGDHPLGYQLSQNTKEIVLTFRSSVNGASASMLVTDLQTGAVGNANYIMLNFSYRVS